MKIEGERPWSQVWGRDALVPTGDTLVTIGDRYDRPVIWSADGGATWRAAETPGPSPGQRTSWSMRRVGDLVLVLAGYTQAGVPPAIWWSRDDGRSFHAARGVAEGVDAGHVSGVVRVAGNLLAFGDVAMRGGRPPTGPARWRSTDEGRTWTRSLPTGETQSLSASLTSVTPVAVGGSNRLVALSAVGSGEDSAIGRPVISDDAGVTWRPSSPSGPEDGWMASAGGAVFFSTETSSWRSEDGVRWRRLGPLPPVPDQEGSGTTLRQGALSATADGALLNVTSTTPYDHYLPHILRSADGGRSWRDTDLGVRCLGGDAEARLSDPAVASGVLFVRWDCAGLGDRGLRLLVSRDDGRSWKPLRQPQLRGIRVGPPTATPDGGVVLLGGRGLDRYVVTLSIDR